MNSVIGSTHLPIFLFVTLLLLRNGDAQALGLLDLCPKVLYLDQQSLDPIP